MDSRAISVKSKIGDGNSCGRIIINSPSNHRVINSVVFSTSEAARLRTVVDSCASRK